MLKGENFLTGIRDIWYKTNVNTNLKTLVAQLAF